jgi:predicted nucleotidyltransferase
MPTTWLDLKHPLNPHLDRLLRDLNGLLRSKGIPYLLTGGMAREILLHHGHGCAPGRATTDVDFGVTLASWQDYATLQAALIDSGAFRPDPKLAQRMLHRAVGSAFEAKVDLVPFGAIAGPRGELAWPPEGAQVMRVQGYAQALASAIHLRLDEVQWVPLASAPGLAAMKLVAWMDRGEARLGRDAVDFLELLHQYSHVLTDQELYDLHPEAMERHAFQVEPAAAFRPPSPPGRPSSARRHPVQGSDARLNPSRPKTAPRWWGHSPPGFGISPPEAPRPAAPRGARGRP